MYVVISYMVTKNFTNLFIDYDTQLLLPLMVVFYKLLMPTTIVESNHALVS